MTGALQVDLRLSAMRRLALLRPVNDAILGWVRRALRHGSLAGLGRALLQCGSLEAARLQRVQVKLPGALLGLLGTGPSRVRAAACLDAGQYELVLRGRFRAEACLRRVSAAVPLGSRGSARLSPVSREVLLRSGLPARASGLRVWLRQPHMQVIMAALGPHTLALRWQPSPSAAATAPGSQAGKCAAAAVPHRRPFRRVRVRAGADTALWVSFPGGPILGRATGVMAPLGRVRSVAVALDLPVRGGLLLRVGLGTDSLVDTAAVKKWAEQMVAMLRVALPAPLAGIGKSATVRARGRAVRVRLKVGPQALASLVTTLGRSRGRGAGLGGPASGAPGRAAR